MVVYGKPSSIFGMPPARKEDREPHGCDCHRDHDPPHREPHARESHHPILTRLNVATLNTSPGFTLTIRRKSLFDVQNSIDPWGIFTLYTSDTCKLRPLAVVRRSRFGRSPSPKIPRRSVRRTTLDPARACRDPEGRGGPPRKTAPLHIGDGCFFSRPTDRGSGFLPIKPDRHSHHGKAWPSGHASEPSDPWGGSTHPGSGSTCQGEDNP